MPVPIVDCHGRPENGAAPHRHRRDVCCTRIAGGWNHPRKIALLPELPRTVTGTIRRVALDTTS